jgi:hypothetical protein
MEAAVGCFTGGFLIDVDHYLDYLVFEKQWHRPGPGSFLRYYFSHSPKKLVLPLHSAEFMILLLLATLLYPLSFFVGYWIGALMHLIFDVLVNGDNVLKRPVPFYVFSYRAFHGFAADKLLDVSTPITASRAPMRDFFRWRPIENAKDVKRSVPAQAERAVSGQNR